uniref:Uncharacterized protein n=1 Tax=Arion vulgaris TaxID=1028688 RepID=A0A0B6YDC5_9EUPU
MSYKTVHYRQNSGQECGRQPPALKRYSMVEINPETNIRLYQKMKNHSKKEVTIAEEKCTLLGSGSNLTAGA